jgi:hypothetical protein
MDTSYESYKSSMPSILYAYERVVCIFSLRE